ncbi:actin maturation protease isoform X2 [Monodelphis domestica]|uniref:actin maturation protease isoform X2 n=1 Tax=Monodelphis domestica TaxID=13616 RepID=UPI0024E26315|nr:actin maturation protease isoform X2 [Monodelphis domestica]
MAAQGSLPPSPPPLPLPALAAAPPHVFGLEKSHLLKAALERSGPGLGALQDIKRLLMLQKDRFRSDLKWILFCSDVPSLIQEGPQCGLVALWMAGSLLALPQEVPLEKIVAVALERGYTAQGEMFSAANMARLAEEVFGCQVELLSGGLGEPNQSHVFQHLISGCPLLVPYPSGLLLGVPSPTLSSSYKEDSELKGLFYPASDKPPLLPEDPPEATYLLSKQGKSWHYQLWDYEQLRESNLQLTDLAPVRTTDGKVYVVPAGGVSEGLCGHTLLLRP